MSIVVTSNNQVLSGTDVGAFHQRVTPAQAGGGGTSPNSPVPLGAILQSATVGTAYTEALSAQGGTTPYSYAVTSGALPTGLSLSGATISGTPSAAGSFSFTITVTDINGNTGSQSFEIIVTTATAGGGAFTFLS